MKRNTNINYLNAKFPRHIGRIIAYFWFKNRFGEIIHCQVVLAGAVVAKMKSIHYVLSSQWRRRIMTNQFADMTGRNLLVCHVIAVVAL